MDISEIGENGEEEKIRVLKAGSEIAAGKGICENEEEHKRRVGKAKSDMPDGGGICENEEEHKRQVGKAKSGMPDGGGICENEEEHKKRVEKAKSDMPDDAQINEMGARFKVISEPSRLKILLALAGGELCVEHITEAVGGNQSAVSHQLKTLKDNKIVRSRRSGKNVLYGVSDWHILTMINVAKEHLNCNE